MFGNSRVMTTKQSRSKLQLAVANQVTCVFVCSTDNIPLKTLMPDDKSMLQIQSLLKLAMPFLNRTKHGTFDGQKEITVVVCIIIFWYFRARYCSWIYYRRQVIEDIKKLTALTCLVQEKKMQVEIVDTADANWLFGDKGPDWIDVFSSCQISWLTLLEKPGNDAAVSAKL